jgi:ABC-type multidrug transport system ATPase subunit
MKISLEQLSKRFQRHWIFKNISQSFAAPGAYALLGANGSGKSTLLRIIAGIQTPSVGKVIHELNGKTLEPNRVFSHIAYCAPGMDLVEELTLEEFLSFHFSFKKPLPGLSVPDIMALTGLKSVAGKPIADYSSGMKQRVKLAQAIFTDTPALLLDEPCTNLDQAGVDQYTAWISTYAKGRLVVVASNDPREYFFCNHLLSVEDYK